MVSYSPVQMQQLAQLSQLRSQLLNRQTRAEARDDSQYSQALSEYRKLIDLQKQQGQALAAQYQQRLAEAQGMLTGYGDVAKADIGRVYKQRMAEADQGLTSRGLGNTTIRSNVQRGMAGAEAQDLARLNEQLTNQKLGVYTQLSGDALQALSGQQALGYQLAGNLAGYIGGYRVDRPGYGPIAQLSAVEAQRPSYMEQRYDDLNRLLAERQQKYMPRPRNVSVPGVTGPRY